MVDAGNAATVTRGELSGLQASAKGVNELARIIHSINRKWWVDLETGQPIQRNVGEMLMLIVSECSEGMEGHRKNLMDTHLTNRPMLEVELADALIRILDMAAGLQLDLGGAFVEKAFYNMTRADHQDEARKAEGGKKY